MQDEQHHFGVYGVFIWHGQILCVRKTRGPYARFLDLPGGSLEKGESKEQALHRELREETGASAKITSPWQEVDVLVTEDSQGNPIRFHHRGQWCFVALHDIDFNKGTLEDVSRLEWLPLDNWRARNDLSALLKAVLGAAEKLSQPSSTKPIDSSASDAQSDPTSR
jgi:8-oxo-dGTP pyrophosphatase MutT (NUDIX family)